MVDGKSVLVGNASHMKETLGSAACQAISPEKVSIESFASTFQNDGKTSEFSILSLVQYEPMLSQLCLSRLIWC